MRNRRRGQILPIFALTLVALFAMAALAIDVSAVYSARQAYRTFADAASLRLRGHGRALGDARASLEPFRLSRCWLPAVSVLVTIEGI